jgi:hypothetical protein
MKIYNPFKPHVAKLNYAHGVRKFSLVHGWLYLSDTYVWIYEMSVVRDFCILRSRQCAAKLLEKSKAMGVSK